MITEQDKQAISYREVYIGCCPAHVFDTDVFAKVHGVLLYDGENIFAVPSYIFETFKNWGTKMLNEHKQKILGGAYGISRGGSKCKFVGVTTHWRYLPLPPTETNN